MTVQPASRYAAGEVLWVNTTKQGNKQTVYLNTMVTITYPYVVQLLREADSMQEFAYYNYGDSNRWWVLADANPQIFYPLDIIPGQQMRVPQ
jgi:hypothetical protein